MQIEYVKASKCVKNTGQIEGLPKNPRQWTQTEVDRLAKSLIDTPELFEARPLLVTPWNDKYIVLGGNMRLTAAKQNKTKDVPAIIFPADTPTEKLREIAIKDNSSFGDWDYDELANKWDDLPLTEWGVPAWDGSSMEVSVEPEATEDDFDEDTDHIEVRCKRGDIYVLGDHRLMCGDSIELADVQRLMGGGLADLWLTDPPYNVAVKNSQGMTIENDNMDSKDFFKFLSSAFKASSSVMSNGCPFYVWFATKEHINFERALNAAGLNVRQELIWNKNHFVLGPAHYQWKHEPCLYGWKGGTCRYFKDSRNLSSVIEDSKEIDVDKMKKDEMKTLLREMLRSKVSTTVIDEKKPACDEDHPTMKPIKLFGLLIANSSEQGDIVLDTFGGFGTTMIAAEQLGRKAYLMELDPHYCDVIIARWEKLTGRKAELLTDNSNA